MEPIPLPFLAAGLSRERRGVVCLMLNLSKCLRDLRQCLFLASLFFPTVIDCMIGHSVRRRCGVEMLQQVPVKSVEIFTRTTHVVAELHVSLAHYPAFPFTLCRGFFTPEIWLVPRKMMRSPICC